MHNDPTYQQPYPNQPYQQPPYPPFQAPPQKPPSLWRRFRMRSRRFQWGIGCGTILFALVACGLCGAVINTLPTPPQTASSPTATATTIQTSSSPTQASQPTNTPTVKPTATKVPTPTPTPSHYPPKTKADLQALAAQGDASAIHEFHSESVGLTGACPQPKRLVTVDPSITGKKLAEDLLAYFYANQLDSPCGSIVFAYHNQSEANDGYTAGRINFDVTDSSGQVNLDPNATGLSYKLTLDVGGIFTSQQEYVVNY